VAIRPTQLSIFELGRDLVPLHQPPEIMVRVGNPEVLVFTGLKEKFEAWKKERGWR
jgi:hypothetical protein